MIYLQLLWVYLKIGFFGFGGGYAMLSLIQNEIVVQNGWLTNAELADIIAVSQITPGPIAINCATYVGYMVTGDVFGSLLATFAVCLPPLTLMMLATRFYLKLHDNRYMSCMIEYMKPMMVGMIGSAALMLFNKESFVDMKSWIIFAICFVASALKVNPILLVVLSAATGILVYS